MYLTHPLFSCRCSSFVVAGANTALGLAERAAEFLASTPVVRCFSILVHRQSGITDEVARGKRIALCPTLFERDEGFPAIDRFHSVVDVFRVVPLIREKGTPMQRERLVSRGEDVNSNSGIHDVGWRGSFV